MEKDFDLKSRLKKYALGILELYSALPTETKYQVIGKQFLRSGTSVGAQYREGCRAKSSADMISKFEGALQELDETDYWLEILFEITVNHKESVTALRLETDELMAILTASVKTIKNRPKK